MPQNNHASSAKGSNMKKSDQSRNLNPIPEAVLAIALWGAHYAAQRGGCMDFWDSLKEGDRMLCHRLVERIREADRAHAQKAA